jgi:hypothetical protein
MQAPPAPQVCDGPLEPVLHAQHWQIEHSTEQSGSTLTRVSEALGPQLGNKETKENEVAFGRVKM